MFFNSFSCKTVLVTGHTGFKGSWLIAWLKKLGANVVGISLDPQTKPSLYQSLDLHIGISDYRLDIRNSSNVEDIVLSTQPDFVFHLAAQALVSKSYEDPLSTWQINLLGTLNLLEALRKLHKPCAAVIITSDKCYSNLEWVWGYRETDKIGGSDPYSASKGASELAIHSHISSFFPEVSSLVRIASARAGNVIGGGDWADHRIVPDCVRAWSNGGVVNLRNPFSTRPWQHVLEPLSGYLTLGALLLDRPDLHGHSFNFGPQAHQNHSVLELVQEMALHWEQVCWECAPNEVIAFSESGLLKLNCDKAHHFLNWHAAMGFEDTVRLTAEWYRIFYQDPMSILSFTDHNIDTYTNFAKKLSLSWSQ